MDRSGSLGVEKADEARLVDACRDHPLPALPPPVVHELAGHLYGVRGDLTRLPSERELVFKLSTHEGRPFVLRIAGEGESAAALAFQNDALQKIEAADRALPVPRVCRSLGGLSLEPYEHAAAQYRVRLLTFIPGIPVLGQARSPRFDIDLGRSLARLDAVLAELSPAPPNEAMFWDVSRAMRLRPLIGHVRDRAHRALVESVFDELGDHGLARLDALPRQVVHNDFNPKNVLVAPGVADRVAGIIDFGDLANAPRIVDLGVAIARHIDVDDALPRAERIVSGYAAASPLADAEISVLFFVVCARLAMRAAIWSWRLSAQDPRCDPSQIDSAAELLRKLRSHGAAHVTDRFRAASAAQFSS